MKRTLLFFSTLLIPIISFSQPIKVMLVAGGHAFDTVQFFQLFDEIEGINYEYFYQPQANREIAKGTAEEFDVLVFYDMWNEISQTEKTAYINLTKSGKPFLFLHHSLASYQGWKQFEKLLGGKYIEKRPGVPEDKLSTYEHDVWIYMEPLKNHPVTKGFRMIKLFDEVYGNTSVSEEVIPLFKTNHPKSSRIIGWENRFNSSKIVYLQPGHDYRSFESEDYKRLLGQAIFYLAGIN